MQVEAAEKALISAKKKEPIPSSTLFINNDI
jgi:hypothetical protein